METKLLTTCPSCGNVISIDSVFCEHCGAKVKEQQQQTTITKTAPLTNNLKNLYNLKKEEEATPIQLIGSFLIPILGVILYAMNNDKKPKMAKSCLIAGIIGFAIALVLNFFIIIIASFA